MCDWSVIFLLGSHAVMYITFNTHLSTGLHYKGTTMEISPWAFLCHPFDPFDLTCVNKEFQSINENPKKGQKCVQEHPCAPPLENTATMNDTRPPYEMFN